METIYKVLPARYPSPQSKFAVVEEFHYDNGPVRIGDEVETFASKRKAAKKAEELNINS